MIGSLATSCHFNKGNTRAYTIIIVACHHSAALTPLSPRYYTAQKFCLQKLLRSFIASDVLENLFSFSLFPFFCVSRIFPSIVAEQRRRGRKTMKNFHSHFLEEKQRASSLSRLVPFAELIAGTVYRIRINTVMISLRWNVHSKAPLALPGGEEERISWLVYCLSPRTVDCEGSVPVAPLFLLPFFTLL